MRIPALRETGVRKFYNGPESFTPDNQFILGAAPEVAELLRRRRLQLRRHRVRRRRRSRARGVDRRTARRPPTSRPSTSAGSRGSTATTAGCTTASPRCSGCTTRSRGPTARCAPRARSGARPLHHVLDEANANFGSRMGWERPNFFAPPGTAPVIEYTWAKPNWLPWVAGGAHQHPQRTSRSSTRRRSRSTSSSDPTPSARSSGCARRTSRCAPGPHRLHRHAQRPRHLRVGRDRHPGQRDRVPRRQQRRHDRAGPGPHAAQPARPAAPRPSST